MHTEHTPVPPVRTERRDRVLIVHLDDGGVLRDQHPGVEAHVGEGLLVVVVEDAEQPQGRRDAGRPG